MKGGREGGNVSNGMGGREREARKTSWKERGKIKVGEGKEKANQKELEEFREGGNV